MKTTTGAVRSLLAKTLARAASGELSSVDGKNIIGIANQISKSMSEEIKHNNMMVRLGVIVDTYGAIEIGESDKEKSV